MLKHILAILILSLIIILGITYVEQFLIWLVSFHDFVSNFLKNIFAGGKWGKIIRELLAILVLPLGAALIASLIYWFLKRGRFPYFMEMLWVIWLVQTTALVVLNRI